MEPYYERRQGRQYLVFNVQSEKDDYRIRMLQEQSIAGCLACQIRRIDERQEFRYEVTSFCPLTDQLCSREFDQANLRLLMKNLSDTIRNLEKYLLPQEGILLDPSYIFTDVSFQHIYFCYVPDSSDHFWESAVKLVSFLLPKLDGTDPECIRIGFAFYRLCLCKLMEADTIDELIPDSENDKVQEQYDDRKTEREKILDAFFADEEEEVSGQGSRILIGIGAALLIGAAIAVSVIWRLEYGIGLGMLLLACAGGIYTIQTRRGSGLNKILIRRREKSPSETGQILLQEEPWKSGQDRFERYDENEETVLLSKSPDKSLHAVLRSMDQKIPDFLLNGESHILGKNTPGADLYLFADGISRMHARFAWTGDGYEVFDLRSKNGTFVNETEVHAGKAWLLKDGDIIRFGKVRFRYESM